MFLKLSVFVCIFLYFDSVHPFTSRVDLEKWYKDVVLSRREKYHIDAKLK